jgi:excinuclease ABC subunit B
MPEFQLVSQFAPMGDQPRAIDELTEGIHKGVRHQTLLGATGTGKTFTIANVVQRVQKPTLVLAHNKTLAAQLYAEFKEFFPNNAVEYFVSYYDYYQPEAYVPRSDLYIEKQTDINEQIERLRLAATASLLTRKDVLIVASVSCIYGIGDPTAWAKATIELKKGHEFKRESILRKLIHLQYSRNDLDLRSGTFRARGDVLEIQPAYNDIAYRIELFGDEVERITEFDSLTGEIIDTRQEVTIFPAKQFIADDSRLKQAITDIQKELNERVDFYRSENRLVELYRLEQRVAYDIEMLREMGYTSGIENYSRHMDQRPAGSPPWTLVDYFPQDFLVVMDESHMTVPQLRGMYNGDRNRKQTLVDFGFRLPSAMDNRPLKFDELNERMRQIIFTSATPGPYEREVSERVVEQIIRPTGLLDPLIHVRPIEGQIDDLTQEVAMRVKKGQRVLITTLTQRMSEELAGYLNELGIKANYLHAEIETLERIEILRDLRMGTYDVIVGINLLREGIDLPEVSLVAILDADKEGFLRSESALIQTVGRAARHLEGTVIMYANHVTPSMQRAIEETNRRRTLQDTFNQAHGIVPRGIVKQIRDIGDRVKAMMAEELGTAEAIPENATYIPPQNLSKKEIKRLIDDLQSEMKSAAKALEFEKAATIRDQIVELRQIMAEKGILDDNPL